jgi:hypothetical protein
LWSYCVDRVVHGLNILTITPVRVCLTMALEIGSRQAYKRLLTGPGGYTRHPRSDCPLLEFSVTNFNLALHNLA